MNLIKVGVIQIKKVKNNLFIIAKNEKNLVLFKISFGVLDFSREKRKTYFAHYILAMKLGQQVSEYKKIMHWNLEFIGSCLHKKAILSGFVNNLVINTLVFKDITLHGGCKQKKKRRK